MADEETNAVKADRLAVEAAFGLNGIETGLTRKNSLEKKHDRQEQELERLTD